MLTGIEIIAGIFALAGLIKIVTILINKNWWFRNVSERVYGNQRLTGFVFFVLAVVVFYFLIQELNLVQILAAVAFGSLLTALAFLSFSKELLDLGKKIISKKFNIWMKFYILIWIVLLAWVLYEIFAYS